MAEKSHTYNSIVNSLFGIGASFVTIVLNFVVRVVLVRTLGSEIYGLQNLFQNITNVMVLMELGISSAMVIHLYKPLKHGDEGLVKSIMRFYRQVYYGIALLFFVVSLVVTLFLLDFLVSTTIDMSLVRLYFFLFTASFSVDYLTYYKRSILYATQRNRVSTGVTALCELLFRTFQIVLVVCFRNYVFFLAVTILEKLVSNVICSIYVDMHHPYLRKGRAEKLASEKRTAIYTTVKPLLVNQLASTVERSSKSILISLLLGNISVVGYYGNYQLVSSVVETIYSQLGGAFTTSFGNLAVDAEKSRMERAYRKTAFLLSWMACFFCAAFLVCVQDFILIVFGAEYVLDWPCVVLIVAYLAVYLLDIPAISTQNAMGLHRLDAKEMALQACLSIVVSYLLGLEFGMAGILGGSIIPLAALTLINKGRVVTSYAFDMPFRNYLKIVATEACTLFVVCAISVFLCSLVPLEASVLSFVAKGLMALAVALIVPGFMFRETQEFKDTTALVRARL